MRVLPSNRRNLLALTMSTYLIGTAEVIAGPMMGKMGAQFGVSSARIAWLPASYAFVYAVLAPFLGPLSDRFGRKPLLVPGLVGLGVAMCLVALAPSFQCAIAASALAGLAAAAIQPNALALAIDGVDPSQHPTILGRLFVGLTLSFVTVPVISGVLAERATWKLAYFLAAGGAWVAAMLLVGLPSDAKPRHVPTGYRDFRRAFGEVGVRQRLAASYLWLGVAAGLSSILAEIVRRRFGLSIETTGVVVGGFGLATMIGNSFAGRVRRWGYRSSQVVMFGIGATMCGCLVVGVFPSQSLPIAAIAGFCWAFGYGVAGPFHQASLSSPDGTTQVTVTSVNASLLNLGIMTVTFAAGRFFDTLGPRFVLATAVAGMAIAFALIRGLDRRRC